MTDYVKKPNHFEELEITASTTDADAITFIGNTGNGSATGYYDGNGRLAFLNVYLNGGTVQRLLQPYIGAFLVVERAPYGAAVDVQVVNQSLSTDPAFETL